MTTRIARLALTLPIALWLGAMPACSAPPATPTRRLMTWDDLLSRPHPKADRTIHYGGDQYQVADLWLPRGAGGHPVVLMIHGGCWTTSIADRTIMDWLADDLRARGIAVWNIDYRGVDRPGGGYPGTFRDAAAGADALRKAAAEYHLDLHRLVAVGHSAGGHLALWLAARPRLPNGSALRTQSPLPIPAVISLGGLPDLEQAATPPGSGCGVEVVPQLVGPATAAHPQVYADTSVPRLAPIGVRQVLVNGANDRIIPLDYASDYRARMQATGDTVTVHVVPDTGHVELVTPESAAWKLAVSLIEQALRKQP